MEWKNRIIGHGSKPASQFQAHPNNWRKHPARQRKAVKGSLDDLGWIDTVIENVRTGHLIDGHERVWQAMDNGDAEVPYIQVDLSEAEEAQALLSLDAIAALAESDAEKIDALLQEVKTDNADVMEFLADMAKDNGLYEEVQKDAEPQIDKAAELNKKWQVQTGDLWQIGDHRLLCGDSTKAEDVALVMGGEKAQMVFTDPPYGVDYDGGTTKRKKLEGDTGTELYAPCCLMARDFSDDKAPLYLWHAGVKGIAAAAAAAAAGYEIRCELVWNKNQAQFGALSAQYKQKHEPCYYCFKKGTPPRWFGPTNEVTVWDVDRSFVNEFHPTQKPIELACRAMKNSSEPSDVVVDFFGGSGSTMVAGENLHRKCRTIELTPDYCAVILERMQNTFPELEIKKLQTVNT